MVSLAWVVGENDLEATVGSVVGPLALFTITVSHIVCILLLKLWGQKINHVPIIVFNGVPSLVLFS